MTLLWSIHRFHAPITGRYTLNEKMESKMCSIMRSISFIALCMYVNCNIHPSYVCISFCAVDLLIICVHICVFSRCSQGDLWGSPFRLWRGRQTQHQFLQRLFSVGKSRQSAQMLCLEVMGITVTLHVVSFTFVFLLVCGISQYAGSLFPFVQCR